MKATCFIIRFHSESFYFSVAHGARLSRRSRIDLTAGLLIDSIRVVYYFSLKRQATYSGAAPSTLPAQVKARSQANDLNDHPDIRRVIQGFHMEQLDIRYSCTNQRKGQAEATGELVIMNWQPAELGGLF